MYTNEKRWVFGYILCSVIFVFVYSVWFYSKKPKAGAKLYPVSFIGDACEYGFKGTIWEI